MKRPLLTIVACSYLTALASIALASQASAPSSDNQSTSATHNRVAQHTGEEVFNNNCARCHMPPMTISPRVTGTIITHMRVRARLSREDEQLLLKYLAP